MFFIDLATGNFVDSSGEKILQPPHFTGFQLEDFEFAFLSNSERYTLPENCEIVILGDVAEHFNSPMFTASGRVSSDRTSVIFTINTSTEEYNQRVKASSTPCIADICLQSFNGKTFKRLVRFNAVADRRLLFENIPPEPLKSYYTSSQVDALFAARELDFSVANVTAVMLDHGEEPYAELSINREANHYQLDFSIAVPAGQPGVSGTAPQRGVDYWTTEDIETIKNHVETAILNGAW